MANYQQYETVLLKDGREATIVEILGPEAYIADVGSSPEDWDTIWLLKDDEIDHSLSKNE